MTTKYQPDFHDSIGKNPTHLNDSKIVFKGKRIEVRVLDNREAVVHPGAVVILPIIDDEHILLIRNERFVVNETLWELPAGTIEPKEQPQETAERELIEETGYSTKNISYLNSFYTSPGICNERMYAYIAKDLTFVGQQLDKTEKITTEILKWKYVKQMLENGTIHDAKTMAVLLYYDCFLSKHN